MDAVLLVIRLLLASFFAAAGGAKLASPRAFRTGLSKIGVPMRLVAPAAGVVPGVELAVAVALVPRDTARGASVATVALVALFTAAISDARARDATFECNCFGRVELLSRGRRPLIRNAALLALGAGLAVMGGGAAGPTLTQPAGVAAALVVVGGVAVAAGLGARRHARGDPDAAPATGSRVSIAVLTGIAGETIDLRSGHPTLIAAWNPTCPPCQYMTPRLAAWEREPPEGAPALVLVSRGGAEENHRTGLRSPIVLDEKGDIVRALGLPGRPAAVLIDGAGMLASGPIVGAAPVLAALRAPR
jgi:thiol-disulfide isomerase/thioredoxin